MGCAAIAVAGSVAVTPSAAAPAAGTVTASSGPEMRFVSYNICGNICGDPTWFDNQRRIDTVVNETSPEVWGAEEVFLSEV